MTLGFSELQIGFKKAAKDISDLQSAPEAASAAFHPPRSLPMAVLVFRAWSRRPRSFRYNELAMPHQKGEVSLAEPKHGDTLSDQAEDEVIGKKFSRD
jgi:hypothetical protein